MITHPLDDLSELPHHIGSFRIAKVEAIAQAQWSRPDTGKVTGRFGHGQNPPNVWIQITIAAIAINGEGKPFAAPLDSNDCSI